NTVYGEVNVDQLNCVQQELFLYPHVNATKEALDAIEQADLILIGPGSFFTSLMPLLLLEDLTQSLRRSNANMIYIGNLGKELSHSAAELSLKDKLEIMENKIGRKMINALIVGPCTDISLFHDRIVSQQVLEAQDIPYRHD
ncbi:2-phospho-L-lactate transferase CofD family protein, partial [Xenorhabdus bovienii]|uniref:2-phospho-L-lactate transferase CofD family protein n=1 Tax=Xenorhabdus bovienii TaxID=40576 RepID=UPI0023B2483B